MRLGRRRPRYSDWCPASWTFALIICRMRALLPVPWQCKAVGGRTRWGGRQKLSSRPPGWHLSLLSSINPQPSNGVLVGLQFLFVKEIGESLPLHFVAEQLHASCISASLPRKGNVLVSCCCVIHFHKLSGLKPHAPAALEARSPTGCHQANARVSAGLRSFLEAPRLTLFPCFASFQKPLSLHSSIFKASSSGPSARLCPRESLCSEAVCDGVGPTWAIRADPPSPGPQR